MSKVWEFIPEEKQIQVEMTIQQFVAEGNTIREVDIERIVDESKVIEKTTLDTESVSKEDAKEKSKELKRVKKTKVVTFPENLDAYLKDNLTRKLKGALSKAMKMLYKACILKSYKPYNEMWLLEIEDIEVGNIVPVTKMVPRNMRGKNMLVPEVRDAISNMKVKCRIANLEFPKDKRVSKQLWKQVFEILKMLEIGAWKAGRIREYSIR